MVKDLVPVPTVIIGGKTYDLMDNLAANDPLVVSARGTIAQTLTVDQLIRNMDLAARQLNIAHLASADYNIIQDKIWQTLVDLQIAVGKSDATMIVIELQSRAILNNMLDAFDYMFSGDFAYAAEIIVDCGANARRLADAAEQMADLYDGMTDSVRSIVTDAQLKTSEEKEALQKLVDTMAVNAARLKALTIDKGEYANQKERVRKLYEDAKSQAETAETRAFVSELVGGIFSAVGTGLQAYAAAKTPSLNVSQGGSVPAGQSIGAPPAGQAPDPADTPGEEPVAAGPAEDAASDASSDAADDAADDGPDDETGNPGGDDGAGSSDPTAGATGTTSDDTTAKPAGKPLSEEENRARTVAAGSTAKEISDRADKMAANATSSAVELRRQVGELLNMEFEIADKQREVLREIASYTEMMKNDGVKQTAIQLAVELLGIAIGALNQVTAALVDAANFWRTMEARCTALNEDSNFITKIGRLKERDPDSVANDVRRPRFVRGAVEYIAGWRALEAIAHDYRIELGRLGSEVGGYVALHPDEDKARQMALSLAADLGMDVKGLLAAKDAQTVDIRRRQAALAE